MPNTETKREWKVPDMSIPMFVVLPTAAGVRAFVLVAHLLRKCWLGVVLVFVVFSIVYWIAGGVFAFLILVTCVLVVLYHGEDALLYHPDNPTNSRILVLDPSTMGLPYESFNIRSADGTMLHVFLIRQPEPFASEAPTVVFLHGNAGNIGHRLSSLYGLYRALKVNLLMLEYRGYGLSQGTPSERGLYLDARAAVDYLFSRSDINHKEVILFGRSLGGAVAIDVASDPDYRSRIWCVMLENTFTSIPAMAQVLLGSGMRFLPRFCYRNKFLSYDKVMFMVSPTLFISGLADSLVPPSMMADLHARCGASLKNRIVFKEGTHNETWRCEGYYQQLYNFVWNLRHRDKIHADQNTVRTQPLMHSVVERV